MLKPNKSDESIQSNKLIDKVLVLPSYDWQDLSDLWTCCASKSTESDSCYPSHNSSSFMYKNTKFHNFNRHSNSLFLGHQFIICPQDKFKNFSIDKLTDAFDFQSLLPSAIMSLLGLDHLTDLTDLTKNNLTILCVYCREILGLVLAAQTKKFCGNNCNVSSSVTSNTSNPSNASNAFNASNTSNPLNNGSNDSNASMDNYLLLFKCKISVGNNNNDVCHKKQNIFQYYTEENLISKMIKNVVEDGVTKIVISDVNNKDVVIKVY